MSSGETRYGAPETRRRILEATRAEVAEHGAAMSLADVAQRAGVSRQAVYLHFGDRTQLLIALVRHMDETLNLAPSLQHVHEADTGSEVISRTMLLHSSFSAQIDAVAQVMESGQYRDEALRAAWRDRMRFRRQTHVAIVQRLADLRELDRDWDVAVAADIFYALTLPAVWREVTRELGWTQKKYVQQFSVFLQRALLAGGRRSRA